MIKAVYFDGDQTLWDFEALMRRSLAATMAQLLALRPETAALDLDVESVVADREAVAEELRGGLGGRFAAVVFSQDHGVDAIAPTDMRPMPKSQVLSSFQML